MSSEGDSGFWVFHSVELAEGVEGGEFGQDYMIDMMRRGRSVAVLFRERHLCVGGEKGGAFPVSHGDRTF